MALKGKPYILTWSSVDNSLRLYRLNSSDVFVSVATSLLQVFANDITFRMGFLNDLAVVSFGQPVNAVSRLQFRELTALNVGSQQDNNNYALFDRFISKRNSHMFLPTTASSRLINPDGTFTQLNLNPVTNSNMALTNAQTKAVVSKDEKLVLRILNDTALFHKMTLAVEESLVSTAYGNYEAITGAAMFVGAASNDVLLEARISDDNRYLAVVRKNTAAVSSIIHLSKIIPTSNTEYSIPSTFNLNVSEAGYQATSASFQPSSKFLAVGFTSTDGTAWRTKIYRRVADAFVLHTTLNGIGATVGFTSDGKFLIDASTRKAYNVTLNETFVENLTMMVNVSAGAVKQAISDHSDLAGIGEVYDAGVMQAVAGTIDYNNLYLMLLKPTARFNEIHATIQDVSKNGFYEVTGPELAIGGIKLKNVVAQSVNPTRAAIKSDNAKQIIVQNDKTFKYAVVYDKTSGIPLTWIDFIDTFTANAGTELTIDLSTNGLLNYYR